MKDNSHIMISEDKFIEFLQKKFDLGKVQAFTVFGSVKNYLNNKQWKESQA